MTKTFTWAGHELELLDHPYNTTILNERCVEVPIASEWLYDVEDDTSGLLEVGNVLGHYGWGGHEVVDLYEVAEGVRNVDVRSLDGEYDRIVSISTLEHVDQETPSRAPVSAIQHLRRRLAPGGRMLATLPFGQAPYLDVAILEGELLADREWTMLRDDVNGTWTEHPGERVWCHAREFGWARAVWIAEWTN